MSQQKLEESIKPVSIKIPLGIPNIEKILPFTWADAILYYPITIPFALPIHLLNSLSGPNGLGYQKFVAQVLIPHNQRVKDSPNLGDIWKY